MPAEVVSRIAFVVVVLLPFSSVASNDFSEEILNLVEGSKLNYSTGVEISSLQSMYACVTKNFSATFDDLDLNASLSVGVCVVCGGGDIGQKCARQFNSSLTRMTVSRLQKNTIQLLNFFEENVSLGDNGTKIICAYATGTDVLPYSAIYLNVSHRPSSRHNLLVPVIVSCSVFFILVIACIICIICISCRCIHICAYKKAYYLPIGELTTLLYYTQPLIRQHQLS